MNLSGKSLRVAINSLELKEQDGFLVLVDDIHLPFGQLRVNAAPLTSEYMRKGDSEIM